MGHSARWIALLAVAAAGCGRIDYEVVSDRDAGPPPPCPPPGAGTVALWTFDGDHGDTTVREANGLHDGTMSVGLVTTVDGPEGCGRAIAFDTEREFVDVPDAPAFQLAVGSLELWLRVDALAPFTRGVVSRDALGRELPGHFTVMVTHAGILVARNQDDTGPDAFRCTEGPVSLGRWLHVGVNFGPPGLELWVDGVQAVHVGDIRAVQLNQSGTMVTVTQPCGSDGTYGLTGNTNPLVIGASAMYSVEGGSVGTTGTLLDGAVDHVHLRSVRRSFGER